MVLAQPLEDELTAFLANVRITDEIKKKVLRKLGAAPDPRHEARERAGLAGQLDGAQQLFLMGDLSEVN